MTIPEIIEELSLITRKFPREALEGAISQQEEITPELLRILEEDTVRIAYIADTPDYMGHFYAMYLLAQFREPRALLPLVKFFSEDSKLVSNAVGDTTDDGLEKLLASTCSGDVTLIKQLIENNSLDECIRASAMEAMVILVKQGVTSREDAMSYFTSLFSVKLASEFSMVWTFLVFACYDLFPEEAMGDIERAYDDGKINGAFIGLEKIYNKLEKGKDRALAALAEDSRKCFVENAIEEMEGWSCFHMSDYSESESTPEPVFAPERIGPKIGRNELCPCGSGKKYKRCCAA